MLKVGDTNRLVLGALVAGVVSLAACGGGTSRPETGSGGKGGGGGTSGGTAGSSAGIAGTGAGTAGSGTAGSSASGTAGTAGSGTAGSSASGTAGTGGSGGSAGTTGTAGVSGTAGTGNIVSNLPNATVSISKTAAGASLVLVSSNLVPDPTSTINYVEWFGELQNNGTSPACLVKVDLDFQSSAGVSVLMLEGYADSDPYMIGTLDIPSACIPPGKSGGIWSNDLPASPVNTASITKVNITIDPFAATGAVPHPAAPTLSGLAIAADTQFGAGNWLLNGTLTATQTIYNIGITAYFRGASGLLIAHGDDTNLGTVTQGSTWMFGASAMAAATPTGYLVSDDFLVGTAGSLSAERTVGDLELRARAEITNARTLRERLRSRADLRTLGARPLPNLAP